MLQLHGVRHKHFCTTNLLSAMKNQAKETDKGHMVDVVYFDFEKSFDTFPLPRLLLKIRSMGVADGLLLRIANFLTYRKQRIQIDSDTSTWSEVRCGVPQGFALGPLLFMMYGNDCQDGTFPLASVFANDIKI